MATGGSWSSPAEVLRARMATRKLTIRGVVNAGKQFSDADPARFQELKKALVWSLLQPGYITPAKPSAALMNTLIMVLYDGDWRAFDRDVKFSVQHTLRTTHEDIHRPGAMVEHYLEGEAPAKQRNRRATPQLSGTHFLLTLRSDALAPRLPAGITAECRRLTSQELQTPDYAGRAIILQGKAKALIAAWYLGERTFQRHGAPFTLPADDSVFGVITWITPTLHNTPSSPRATRPPTPTPATNEAPYPASTPAMKTVSVPAPRQLQTELAAAALDAGIPIREYVEDAITELTRAAEHDLDIIPADQYLERPREDAGNPIMSHLIDAEIHRSLKKLTLDLTRHRDRRFYMNELIIHALRQKLSRH